jgi:hypothetical protein
MPGTFLLFGRYLQAISEGPGSCSDEIYLGARFPFWDPVVLNQRFLHR